jgi:hypothetical protein
VLELWIRGGLKEGVGMSGDGGEMGEMYDRGEFLLFYDRSELTEMQEL